MDGVPLAARVVEVITDLGQMAGARYRYGSGCIVRGRTVLTAAHVVADAGSVVVRAPDKREYTATVDPRFVGDVDGPRPDLALLEIDDPAFNGDLPPIGLAMVDRDSAAAEPVERCHAVGYPWFAEAPSRVTLRDTVDAIGVVPVLSKLAAGLLSVQVTVAPRELPPQEATLQESEWSGMSGGPVVAGGCLLGVVTEHAPREGPSAITAVPLSALEHDPVHPGWGPGVGDPAAWWSRLGVTDVGDLRRLPPHRRRAEPAYGETLREFGRTLHQRMPQLLGREQELADIAAFTAGRPGYRWLVGGAFAGKTALLFEAVTTGLPAEVDVVSYFLSRRASDADSSRFLAAVVPQLAYLCEVDPPAADRDQFGALWRQATERAAEMSRPLLLVVDGLDEDLHPAGSPSVASLLPTLVEGVAHVLVASRPYPELPVDVLDGHPLTAATIRVELEPFKGAQMLADLARQEIHNATHGADADLAVDVLGLLTAAAGPLSVRDLATLSNNLGTPSAAHTRQVRRLVTEDAARSLEPVGPAGHLHYQFAHYSLLQYAQATEDLSDPEYRDRLHRWAKQWQDAGWPITTDVSTSTPRYLLDNYSGPLTRDSSQLATLVTDVGWIDAAIQSVGVDRVLADLRRAAAVNPPDPAIRAMLAVVAGQAHYLRDREAADDPGFVPRQLCLQAAELGETLLFARFRTRQLASDDPGPVLQWTTRRANPALIFELGRDTSRVQAAAALPDGRVVTGGSVGGRGRVLVWNPDNPGAGPVELGRHGGGVDAMAALSDGRVVTGGSVGGRDRVLVWNPDNPGAGPVELGRVFDGGGLGALAALPNRRVVSGSIKDWVLVWNPDKPGADPVKLGHVIYGGRVVAVLPDGRLVTGGGLIDGGRVLVWNPGAGPVELGRHRDRVDAMAVLPDGRVVTGGGGVLVWNPGAPGAGPVELGRYEDRVGVVAALPDGRVVTGGGINRDRVLVWNPGAPGAGPVELGRHGDGSAEVAALAVLPDGRVVTGGSDGRVLVWDPGAAQRSPVEFVRYDDEVEALAVLPDGRVVTGDDVGRVMVWDPGAPGAGPVELGRHRSRVHAAAVLPDGRVVTGEGGGGVLVWDPDHPRVGPVEFARPGPANVPANAPADAPARAAGSAVAVLPDGRVVTGGDDGWVLVWDLGGPVELGRAEDSVNATVVLPGGQVVSVGGFSSGDRMTVRDPVELGRAVGGVNAVAVLPGGRVVSVGGGEISGGDRMTVWDPRVGPVELGRHRGPVELFSVIEGGELRAVAVLPDGRVASGSIDGRVLVWDPDTPGADPVELGRHRGRVAAVAVLPDGRVVTSGGVDGRVRLWDVRSSSPGSLLACSAYALATFPSPSGAHLFIGHTQGGISCWEVRAAAQSTSGLRQRAE